MALFVLLSVSLGRDKILLSCVKFPSIKTMSTERCNNSDTYSHNKQIQTAK